MIEKESLLTSSDEEFHKGSGSNRSTTRRVNNYGMESQEDYIHSKFKRRRTIEKLNKTDLDVGEETYKHHHINADKMKDVGIQCKIEIVAIR